VLIRTPQGRAKPIDIEIGKLPEIDFDFDIDTELPQFENNIALQTGRFFLVGTPGIG
jgi:hypothetical protein